MRSNGKYRLYSQEALDRIQFIHKCQDRRLSLEEIGCIIKSDSPADRDEIYFCMTQAVISIDIAVGELRTVGKKVGHMIQADSEPLRSQADIMTEKIRSATEILQSILNNLA